MNYAHGIIRKLGWLVFIALVGSACLLMAGCDGEKGDTGDMGPVGPAGPEGPEGPEGPAAVVIVSGQSGGIQDAIDSVASLGGGQVFVKAGTYSLSQGLHINNSNITLTGEQGAIVRLADHVNQPVLLIGSDEEAPTYVIENIRIENLELDGNMDGQDSENDPSREWIRNNCIDIRSVNDLWVSEVNLHHARSGGLVASWNCRYVFVDKSSFHHNYFDAIALYASQDIQVSNFFCYENNSAGLSLDNDLSNVIFSTGSIRNNGDVGIFARNSTDLTFNSLMVSENGSHGCFLSHESVGTGTGVTRLFFNSCCFADNEGYGFWLASPSTESPGNCLSGCLFSGNIDGAVELDGSGELYQEGNIYQ